MVSSDVDSVDDFDESPRPLKRQRSNAATLTDGRLSSAGRPSRSRNIPKISKSAPFVEDIDDEEDDDAFNPVPFAAARSSRAIHHSSDEGSPAAKKIKHRIFVPENEVDLADVYVTQPPPPSSSPGRIRGPIWLKKPPLQKPQRTEDTIPVDKSGTLTLDPRSHTLEPTRVWHNDIQHTSNIHVLTVSNPPVSKSLVGGRSVLSHVSEQPQKAVSNFDLTEELADLPSDAFFSSSASSSESPKNVIEISSQPVAIPARPLNARAPQAGLRQTTLHGGTVEKMSKASQHAKKHAWPLATQNEPPTHHKLNTDALTTWVYPTNLGTIRDYQYSIVSTGLFHNLLVALPTGLGKTFIAATVMLNFFRWTTDAQIVFVAPTKPLVAQQVDACFHVAGIPRSQTVMLTGTIEPGLRAQQWLEKRVFFMTPQTIINDLKTGICDPKRIVLVVVDEAHRATGGYAYTEVVKFLRRFNQSFRVLALTATPGSKVEAVQQVVDGLDISRVEIRTEQSLDIRQYVHSRDTESVVFDYSMEQEMIMDLFSKALKPVLDKLTGQNAYWLRDPMKLTPFGLTQAQRQWSASEAGRKAPHSVKGMVHALFTVLASLAHSIPLLKFHGIGPFFRKVLDFKTTVDSGATKSKYASQIRSNESFVKMMGTIQAWINNPDFIGHPKLDHLRSVVLNHFMDAGEGKHGAPPSATRVMVFAQWRDSAEEIARVLKRNEPMIRPHVFVGQADAKGSEGMGQKRQLEVIQQFKDGIYNTLVATSIGEEGLDIGEVDLIICYDASASPIRMLQRMGRTGRKRKGTIVLLLNRDKEEGDFEAAKDNYEKMQAMIASGKHFTFHDDRSPRILPKDVQPVVDKRVVEIPVENSQADLPEPKKNGKRAPKRPPKKFHMPDGVRTGFVKASRMQGGDDGSESEDERPRPKVKTKSKKPTVTAAKAQPKAKALELAQLPFLEDVLLNRVQERELERKYRHVNDRDGGAVVTAPRLDRFPDAFTELGRTRYVGHGRATIKNASTLRAVRDTKEEKVQSLRDNLRKSDLRQDVEHLMAPPISPSGVDSETEVEDEAPLPKTKPRRPGRGRGCGRENTYSVSAMDGVSSSPENTPADMRIATQGIDLGSEDTSGEEAADDVLDSELADFVVPSDQPLELASSSLPELQSRRRQKRSLARKATRTDDSEEDLPELDSILGQTGGGHSLSGEKGVTAKNGPSRSKKRRQVIDHDSDE